METDAKAGGEPKDHGARASAASPEDAPLEFVTRIRRVANGCFSVFNDTQGAWTDGVSVQLTAEHVLADPQDENEVRAHGGELWRVLTEGNPDWTEQLDTLVRQTSGTSQSVRVVLRLDPDEGAPGGPSTAARLAWETLQDPRPDGYGPLAIYGGLRLVRMDGSVPADAPTTALASGQFVAAFANPTDLQTLNMNGEIAALQAADLPGLSFVAELALGKDRVGRLFSGATLLHFGGHANAHALRLVGPDGKATTFDTTSLRADLAKNPPRVAVLNSCGAMLSDPSHPPALSQLFLLAGSGAVIAWQAQVLDAAAALFAKSLYDGLAAGNDVEASVQHARRALYRDRDDHDLGTSWAASLVWVRTTKALRLGIADSQRTSATDDAQDSSPPEAEPPPDGGDTTNAPDTDEDLPGPGNEGGAENETSGTSPRDPFWLLHPPPGRRAQTHDAVCACTELTDARRDKILKALCKCTTAFTGFKVTLIWLGAVAWVLPLYVNLRFSDLAVFNLFQIVLFTFHAAKLYGWVQMRFFVLDQPGEDEACHVASALETSDRLRVSTSSAPVRLLVHLSWLLYLIAPLSLVGFGHQFRALGVPRGVFMFFGVQPPGRALALSDDAKNAVFDGGLAMIMDPPCDTPHLLDDDAVYLLGGNEDQTVDLEAGERRVDRPTCWIGDVADLRIAQLDASGKVFSWCECTVSKDVLGNLRLEDIGTCERQPERSCSLRL